MWVTLGTIASRLAGCSFARRQLIVVALLEAGADFSLVSAAGHTALSLAQDRHHRSVVAVLEKPPLHFAARVRG